MSEVSKVHTGPSIQSNVTRVKGVESSSICTIRAVMLFMSKVSKVAQNNWGLYYLCMSKVLKEHTHVFTHNFLNIQLIFNPQKVLESWDLGLFNHTIKCYLCQRCWRLFWPSTPLTCFNIHSIWWHGSKALSLSFPKLFLDWKSSKY